MPSRSIASLDPGEPVTRAPEDLRSESFESVELGDFVIAGENFGSRPS